MTRILALIPLRLILLLLFVCLLKFATSTAFAQDSDADSSELESLLEEDSSSDASISEEEITFPDPAVEEEIKRGASPVFETEDPDLVQSSDELFLPMPSEKQLDSADPSSDEEFRPYRKAGKLSHDNQGVTGRLYRPFFTFLFGNALKTYSPDQLPESFNGYHVGIQMDIISKWVFDRPLKLRLMADAAFLDIGVLAVTNTRESTEVAVGEVSAIDGVSDRIFRYGLTLEYELSRRIQIYGALFRYQNRIESGEKPNCTTCSLVDITNEINQDELSFGGGINWDFLVVPHGSVGAELFVMPTLLSISLTFSVSPAPRTRKSANHTWEVY